jgi:hypothetical protein
MPRHPMARGIAVVIVHGRRLWAGPRHPAGVVLGALTARSANSPVTGLTHNCLGRA